MSSLYDISTEVRNIYEELESGIGIDEETGEILPEILERLKISKENLNNKAVDYGYVIKSFEDEISLYDKEIKRLTERKKQMQNIQQRIKDNIKFAMLEFGIEEVKGKTIKLSFRNSESVEIEDANMLDEKYKRTKIIIEPDKIAIKEAIKNGEEVKGAKLVNNKSLQIK